MRMSVLIAKNIITEGPGTIEDFLKAETEKVYEEYTGRAMNFYKTFFRKG